MFFRLPGSRIRVLEGESPRVLVRLSGHVVAANAEKTGQRLRDALWPGVPVLEVDLSRVRYVSADGIAAFFIALRAARANGTHLAITHAQPPVQSVMRQVGLTRVIADPHRNPPPVQG